MDNKICQIHNEPAQFCEQDAQQNQNLQQLESKYDEKIQQLKYVAEIFEQYTQQIQQELNKFKLQVDQNMQNIIEKKNQFKNISNDSMNFQQNQIDEEEKIINNQLKQIKQQLIAQLRDIDIIDNLLMDLNSIAKVKDFKMINKKFDFQLIQQSSVKQYDLCGAIAFNKSSTIMIAGCRELIKVFEFKEDNLREVQQLNGHSDNVYCLKFLQKFNQFISAGADSTIIIWECNQNNQWQMNQVLNGHTNYIWCITMNQNEDLMISGSKDKTIKFWNKLNNIWSSNQSIDCNSDVLSISLNDQEYKLIVSVSDKQILIMQLQGKEWMIQQKIQVESIGFRLYFINQDQFLFQPYGRQYLEIFNFDQKDQNFKKGQELQYSNKELDGYPSFPIRYISLIGLIMVKNDQHVHLIKRSGNGLFTVEQSFKFNTDCLYGGMTDDGRYLATWDDRSFQIQIRKFEY